MRRQEISLFLSQIPLAWISTSDVIQVREGPASRPAVVSSKLATHFLDWSLSAGGPTTLLAGEDELVSLVLKLLTGEVASGSGEVRIHGKLLSWKGRGGFPVRKGQTVRQTLLTHLVLGGYPVSVAKDRVHFLAESDPLIAEDPPIQIVRGALKSHYDFIVITNLSADVLVLPKRPRIPKLLERSSYENMLWSLIKRSGIVVTADELVGVDVRPVKVSSLLKSA